MSITAASTISRARTILQDPDKTRWSDAEGLTWINEGRRALAGLKPSVFGNGTELTYTTTSGNKQRLSNGSAYALASIDYNVSTGRVIRQTTRQQLDSFHPEWRADDAEDEAVNWFPDDTDQLAFWIYPSVGAGKSVKLHAYLTPTDLQNLTDVALPYDQYELALCHYVCYRFYSKDAEYGGNAALAQSYLQLFTEALK